MVSVLICQTSAVDASQMVNQSTPGKRRVEFTYKFTIKDVPPDAGSIIAWVPCPAEDENQTIEDFDISGVWPVEYVIDEEFGNRFARINLTRGAGKEGGIAVNIGFTVTRSAYRVLTEQQTDSSQDQGVLEPMFQMPGTRPDFLDEDQRVRYLAPDSLVPTSGKIAEEALKAAGGTENREERARMLYDHVVSTMSYDKSGEGWGRGDAMYACDVRRGNCTDFHSLYIGEARSLGIPSRFIIGFPLPEDSTEGEIGGYHCWAEYYSEEWGWVPLDASEAAKHPEKKEELFGGLDANRIEFTRGRDIKLPGAQSGTLNYVIYPHVEMNGKTHQSVVTHFSFRELEQQRESEPEQSILAPQAAKQ
jgi:transglutaminase-like putative cysteine protease